MNIAQMSFKEFISTVIIKGIIQPITVLIFALAILYFLWNITQFIRKSDDPKEIENFKKNAKWGIVAIFVMASLWGLVQILINSFVPGSGLPTFNSGSPSTSGGSGDFFQYRVKSPSFDFSGINAETSPDPYDWLNKQSVPYSGPNYGLTEVQTLQQTQGSLAPSPDPLGSPIKLNY